MESTRDVLCVPETRYGRVSGVTPATVRYIVPNLFPTALPASVLPFLPVVAPPKDSYWWREVGAAPSAAANRGNVYFPIPSLYIRWDDSPSAPTSLPPDLPIHLPTSHPCFPCSDVVVGGRDWPCACKRHSVMPTRLARLPPFHPSLLPSSLPPYLLGLGPWTCSRNCRSRPRTVKAMLQTTNKRRLHALQALVRGP